MCSNVNQVHSPGLEWDIDKTGDQGEKYQIMRKGFEPRWLKVGTLFGNKEDRNDVYGSKRAG